MNSVEVRTLPELGSVEQEKIMLIQEMIVGNLYLTGDSYGYDVVLCVEAPERITEYCGGPCNGWLVKVKDVKTDEIIELMSNDEYPAYAPYIEPRY